MYLTGFGHAVSIGAEAVGRTTYLWTETDVDTANGRGRQIARFPWQNGATLTKDSAALRSWKPVADGAVFTPVGGPAARPDRRSGTRWPTASTSTCTRWRPPRAGNFSTRARLVQAARDDRRDRLPGLGAVRLVRLPLGRRGVRRRARSGPRRRRSSGATTSTPARSSSRCRSWTAPTWSTARPKASGCTSTTSERPRLCFGFASGVTGDRRANLFYREPTARSRRAYWATPYKRSPASPRPGTM